MIEWTCPECGTTIHVPGLKALRLVKRAGKCQGCRAAETFRKNPGLVGLITEFWARADSWPESSSWMAAVTEERAAMFGFGASQVIQAA